ncbi:hydrogenase expression/formation protein HypE [Oleidesulfovibrio alaskensis G20]|jgi:hydrogenase expression/formation protein HypE|uniref:Hydrogenase expression/formation protein HypE n=1 Tax=Oleidesulfovibrio alaskensis (strain ATCC BAA-1058 / DSM 17464 / G20) TaxID=207559 RepID=Q316I2_OLEA2|nr:hydrogenase expression/formation protein HypE [Oleidesulfovibrio alaskensis]ABB37164.1 hydrogenase expression/formation protein HypE [Oleidesulfovibrio alaskensis G20]MBG0774586.1 hydrogenase expression/formation protein HypE [Oleidesulfovibrio alaskensis]MBL3582966.1 hydrogenase expression/formation protein HypE [Oleidesulfovibrio alaskensis]
MTAETLLLDYGSGGRASQRLIAELFFKHFDNPYLTAMNDGAVLDIRGPVAMSTDSYTVDPLFFPGGDIGTLAVHGTVNDVAMMGARPAYLSCGFILEEGLPMETLERIVTSMGLAARESGVLIVTGDTKVVPRGCVDKIFINTTGVGEIIADPAPAGDKARPGDVILVSGTMGDHGLTILSHREGLSFATDVASDSAPLARMVERLTYETGSIHVLRDPTRGGLATTLNEIAAQSGMVFTIREEDIPVRESVRSGCSFLGLDPLYLANEGKLICILPADKAQQALEIMRQTQFGGDAAVIGQVLAPGDGPGKAGQVVMQTPLGGHRLLNMLEGEQLPRIC